MWNDVGKLVKLWDIADFQYGYTASATEKKLWPKFLRITDIVPDIIDRKKVPYCKIEKSKLQNNSLEIWDIVIARTWATAGYAKLIRYLPEDAVFASYLIRVRVKEWIHRGFVWRIIESDIFKKFVETNKWWSAQPHANAPILKEFQFLLPPLPTQQRIASILSNYDDLIENNNRRIQILEEQAQSLYRHWFVDFKFPWHENVKMIESGTEFGMTPEGWKVKSLGEDILVKKWKNITKKTIIEWNVPVVAWWLNPAYFHNRANVHWPAITISASWANSWYVNIYYEDIWCSDCSYISYAETNNLFYYYTQLHFRQNEITHLQKGSAQPHVYPQDIMWLKVVSSIIWLESIFENTVTSFYNEIGNLKKQNINLRKQRDLLLPRLISGEILVD